MVHVRSSQVSSAPHVAHDLAQLLIVAMFQAERSFSQTLVSSAGPMHIYGRDHSLLLGLELVCQFSQCASH